MTWFSTQLGLSLVEWPSERGEGSPGRVTSTDFVTKHRTFNQVILGNGQGNIKEGGNDVPEGVL